MRIPQIVLVISIFLSSNAHAQVDSSKAPYKHAFKLNVVDFLTGNAALFYDRTFNNGDNFEVSLGYQYAILFNSNHENFSTLQLKRSKGITSSLGCTFMSKKHPMHGFQLRLEYKFIQLDSVEKFYEWTTGDGNEYEGNPSLFYPIEYEIGNGEYSIVNMTERRHVLKQQFFWVIRNKPHNKFLVEFYTGPSIRFIVFDYDIHTIWPGLSKNQGEFNYDNYRTGLWHLHPMVHAGIKLGLRT